jgi:hypothetical protein
MQIWDTGWKEFGSGMEKTRIRDNIPDPQHCREVTSTYWHHNRYLDKNREN